MHCALARVADTLNNECFIHIEGIENRTRRCYNWHAKFSGQNAPRPSDAKCAIRLLPQINFSRRLFTTSLFIYVMQIKERDALQHFSLREHMCTCVGWNILMSLYCFPFPLFDISRLFVSYTRTCKCRKRVLNRKIRLYIEHTWHYYIVVKVKRRIV